MTQAVDSPVPQDRIPDSDSGTFASLRLPNFRLLLLGTTLSNAATWIQQITLGWLVYDWTGSGTALGTVNLVRSFATVGLAPVSGTIIDRFSRRRLMIGTNLWMLVTCLVIGLLLVTGQGALWQLYVFTFLGGLAQVIDMPLRQTVVFDIVPRRLAPNALALVQTGWGLMRSIGPSLGGFLIVWFGAGGNFLVQAAISGVIAINILRISFPPHKEPEHRRPMLQNMRDGLAFVAHEPVTRTFLTMGWILPLFIIPNFSAMPPIYAKTVFGGGPEVLGLLLSAVGVGGIAGGLVSASLARIDRRGRVQVGAMLLVCASLTGFAFTTTLVMALPLLALAGFFELIFITGNQTLLQLSIPDDLRGRVTSLTTLNAGLAPIGAMLAGIGADVLGPKEVTVLFCLCAALVTLGYLIWVPLVRNYSIRQAISTSLARSEEAKVVQ